MQLTMGLSMDSSVVVPVMWQCTFIDNSWLLVCNVLPLIIIRVLPLSFQWLLKTPFPLAALSLNGTVCGLEVSDTN